MSDYILGISSSNEQLAAPSAIPAFTSPNLTSSSHPDERVRETAGPSSRTWQLVEGGTLPLEKPDMSQSDNLNDEKEGTAATLRRRSLNVGKSIKKTFKALARRSMSVSYSVSSSPKLRKSLTLDPHFEQRVPSPILPNTPLLTLHELSDTTGQYTATTAIGSEADFPLPASPLITVVEDKSPSDDRRLSPITPFNDSITTESLVDVVVPRLLQQGTPLLKISNKKRSAFVFRLDADQGQIVWESKVHKFIPVENIKEIRTGQAAISHITQLQCIPVEEYLPRWLTLIYVGTPANKARSKPSLSPHPLGSPKSTYSVHTYKTLHLIASTPLIVQLWERTLKAMVAFRASLASGLGGVNSSKTMEEARQILWERSFWTAAGSTPRSNVRGRSSRPGSSAGRGEETSAGSRDEPQCLSLNEMQTLCERLNVRMSEDDVRRLFNRADVLGRGFLDFKDFRRFGKLLKARPDLKALYTSLVQASDDTVTSSTSLHRRSSSGSSIDDDGTMTFVIFESFMREKQKSELSVAELKDIFNRYSVEVPDVSVGEHEKDVLSQHLDPLFTDLGRHLSTFLPTPPPSTSSSSSLNVREFEADLSSSALFATSSSPSALRVMTRDTFTSFLLSTDNPTCLEPRPGFDLSLPTHGHEFAHHSQPNVTTYHRLSETSHDMTQPLSDYYISSSHNTYLVGHQLYGESTVEGYIRAFLGGCRSVELDIFDTDTGPQIFHGKTLTSKVPLREVCEVIMTYGFVASQYPLIISAEIHCGLVGQSQLVQIMKDVFGDRLVRRDENGAIVGQPTEHFASTEGTPIVLTTSMIEKLPSPEELKGRILVKAKNLYKADRRDPPPLSHSSSTSSGNTLGTPIEVSTSSTSDTDAVFDMTSHSHSRRGSGHTSGGETQTSHLVRYLTKGKTAREMLHRAGSRRKSDSSYPPSAYFPRGTPISSASSRSTSLHSRSSSMDNSKVKPKMSPDLFSLLVYTVGVKCRGINKKEVYGPEEMFSLSENMANKMLKAGMIDLIKHTRGHLVRIYPKGMRVNSTNYEPHRYWGAGTQLVAINWQTVDLGYMINHAMFQRNGGCGYLLKPLPLRMPHKGSLSKQTQHFLNVTIISAQHLPAPKDPSGRELSEKFAVNPYVQVTIHVPDWPTSYSSPATNSIASGLVSANNASFAIGAGSASPTSPPFPASTRLARNVSYCTSVVRNNGFNPVWGETLRIPFTCVGDMKDLIFVRFAVRHGEREDSEPLAQFCASLGCLQHGYRHLPLQDSQMSQYLFSTLFVRIDVS